MATWKTDIDDLRGRAADVMQPVTAAMLGPRSTAQCLSGVVGLVARRFSVDVMQQACAVLVRDDRAWRTSLRALPYNETGRVPEPIELLAVVARGLLPLAGEQNLRSALSFWAVESDPAIWAGLSA